MYERTIDTLYKRLRSAVTRSPEPARRRFRRRSAACRRSSSAGRCARRCGRRSASCNDGRRCRSRRGCRRRRLWGEACAPFPLAGRAPGPARRDGARAARRRARHASPAEAYRRCGGTAVLQSSRASRAARAGDRRVDIALHSLAARRAGLPLEHARRRDGVAVYAIGVNPERPGETVGRRAPPVIALQAEVASAPSAPSRTCARRATPRPTPRCWPMRTAWDPRRRSPCAALRAVALGWL